MRIVRDLFDELAAACQFPYYFGENWPAFAECLGDLDWMNSLRFVLIITEFEEVLATRSMRYLPLAARSYLQSMSTIEEGKI